MLIFAHELPRLRRNAGRTVRRGRNVHFCLFSECSAVFAVICFGKAFLFAALFGSDLNDWLHTIKEILDDPQPDAMDFLDT
ncbi:MAG: hypothetical protein IKH75_02740, partial [Ruminococcus sp.]|nr:hypothetical protein [Ruminococcus sp.]